MPNRRSFLKTTSQAASAVALTSPAVAQKNSDLKSTEQATFRNQLQQCLGGAWPDPIDLNVTILNSEIVDDITRITLTYELEPGDHCPAIFLIPNQVDASHPAPAIAI